jgi:hypothetical protein
MRNAMIALVHIHKTAGTTLDDILARSYGVRHCHLPALPGKAILSAEDYRRAQRLWPPFVSITGHSVSAVSDLERARPDVRYYTFLRDPLVRCASHYQYQVQFQRKNYAFEEWIARGIKRNPATTRIAGPNATAKDAIQLLKTRFVFVGLVERFDESLVLLRKLVCGPGLDIWYRKRLVAASDDIKERLLNDPRSRALLVDANREDSELYDFAVNELYPTFKKQYGDGLESDAAQVKKANGAPGRIGGRVKFIANHYVSRQLLGLKRTMAYYS